MRVDILHTFSNEGNSRPWEDVLGQAHRRIVLADKLGIDGFWVGEHHFDHAGTDQSPNPVLIMADLASRTENIRIGIAAIILPTWHPLRLAEDLAALDHFTDGRLDVALSRGILQAEIINLNAEADRANDQLSKDIFAERLGVLRGAWRDDPFSWKSERFQIPHPDTKWPGVDSRYTDDDGKVTGLSVIPRPKQPGGPTLYNVTDTPGGFKAAAQQELNVITWFPTRGVLDNLNAVYRAEMEANGTDNPALTGKSAILRGCLIAPTDEEARSLAEPEVQKTFDLIDKVRGLKIWLDADEDPTSPEIVNKKPFDLLFERDHLLIGSPETVAQKMIDSGRNQGVEHWLLSPYNDEDEACVEQTLRLLAEEVLPKVRAALGS